MSEICNDIEACASHIKSGELVSFPTETVYGLGANALDAEAVLKIFKAKGRPLTDPVIVHVTSLESALSLIDEENESIKETYTQLAREFWPGPLTIVCKASAQISPVLTASTGYVGIRCPSHPIARELINKAGVPIAAPSANLFAHVSPTSAEHVMADFSDSKYHIKVIEGGRCAVGIESTIVRLLWDNGVNAILLRKGGVSQEALKRALPELNLYSKENYISPEETIEAPGQNLKHYSPNIDAFFIGNGELNQQLYPVEQAVVIDFGGRLRGIQAMQRRDLSERGDAREAANNLYEFLRWSEGTGASCVLLPDLSGESDEHIFALQDRMFRSTSGRKVGTSDGHIYTLIN